jgi:hypothetical protein
MLTSIQFDHELPLDTAEIDNEGSYRMLSAKFEVAHAPSTQIRPKPAFGVGRIASHFARVVHRRLRSYVDFKRWLHRSVGGARSTLTRLSRLSPNQRATIAPTDLSRATMRERRISGGALVRYLRSTECARLVVMMLAK